MQEVPQKKHHFSKKLICYVSRHFFPYRFPPYFVCKGPTILASRVDIVTCTLLCTFLSARRLYQVPSLCGFASPEPVSSYVVGFYILLRPPSPMALFYSFLWYCSARRNGYHKGNCEGQNQGELLHTLLSASSIISAFMCRSPPSEVDFVYVGFSHERGGRQACRSQLHFVNVHCGSVKALFLVFQYSECWISGLQLLMFEI